MPVPTALWIISRFIARNIVYTTTLGIDIPCLISMLWGRDATTTIQIGLFMIGGACAMAMVINTVLPVLYKLACMRTPCRYCI